MSIDNQNDVKNELRIRINEISIFIQDSKKIDDLLTDDELVSLDEVLKALRAKQLFMLQALTFD